jgi:hypothetical protein
VLGAELERAGFHQVNDRTHVIPAPWPGSPEEYWQQFYDVAVPMRPLFDSLAADDFTQARAEAVNLLRTEYNEGMVHTSVAVVVASGTR